VTVSVGDTAGFVRGIETVLDGVDGKPRERVVGSFDWSDTAERTTTVLEELQNAL
jgi:hypothetical protein